MKEWSIIDLWTESKISLFINKVMTCLSAEKIGKIKKENDLRHKVEIWNAIHEKYKGANIGTIVNHIEIWDGVYGM